MTAESSLAGLRSPDGGIDPQIQAAAGEVIQAAQKAGYDLPAVSWFNPASTPEHHVPGMAGSKGVAVDFMVYNNRAMGDWFADYLWNNRDRLGVCWIIWYRRIRSTTPGKSGQWTTYVGPSQHTDHVHVNFGKLVGTNGYGKVAKVTYRSVSAEPSLGNVWVDLLVPGVKDSDTWRLVQRALGVQQTGEPDTATIEAAKAFQKSLGDDVDGWLGPKQVTRLFADKKMSVTVRLDASGQAPKPPAPQKPDKPVTPAVDPKPTSKPKPITLRLKAWDGSPAGRTLIQGALWDAVNSCYFIHQADDVAGQTQQNIVVRRHKGDGTYVGYTTVAQAGHGSSIGLDPFQGGARLWIGHATKGSGFLTYTIGSSDTPFTKVPGIPKGDLSADSTADILVVRSGTSYRGYKLSDARAGKVSKVFDARIQNWLTRFQGHLVAGKRIYIHRDQKTKGASELRCYDFTGKLLRKWDTSGWGDEAEGAMVKDGWVFSVSRVGGAGPDRTILCTPIEEF